MEAEAGETVISNTSRCLSILLAVERKNTPSKATLSARRSAQAVSSRAAISKAPVNSAGRRSVRVRVLVLVIVVFSTANGAMDASVLGILQVVPAKGVVTLAMVLKMMKALHRLSHGRNVALGHPPHHKARALLVEVIPLGLAVIKLLVNGVKDEMAKAGDVLPDRQGRGGPGIATQRPAKVQLRRLHILVFHMPDIARTTARDVINAIKVVLKVRHPRIVPVVFQGTYVELSEGHLQSAVLSKRELRSHRKR
mmetsp:Transcript_22259/g.35384  ORF Transcript_22259/g.35384 Transcript_22259/m.35384 type:complete len:253 (+) Transcript_22259:1058-1816(+)